MSTSGETDSHWLRPRSESADSLNHKSLSVSLSVLSFTIMRLTTCVHVIVCACQ